MTTEDTLARLEALCAAALADTERAPGMGRYSRAWDVYSTAARDACPALLRIARAADAVLCRSRFRGQWLETPAYSALAELDKAMAALGGEG